MNYDYLICGLRVRFAVPWELKLTAESRPFLVGSDAPDQPDLTMAFCAVDSLTVPETGGTWNLNSYYLTEEGRQCIWHCPVRGNPPYCCVVWNDDSPATVTCYYVRQYECQIPYTRNLLQLLGLETFLLRFDALMLHASLVDWEGRGILFCGPCGIGKSTQATLWEQSTGSRTLNGDRAGIRSQGGVWTAWGMPFAGSSGIYRNESAPIKAVVLLRQGPENLLTPVRPLDAFKRMLPECSAQRWSAAFMNRLVGKLSELIYAVPIYQLECRPDVGSVELLRDTILKEI